MFTFIENLYANTMKAIILTSSIFYLLGLKLTTQVELNQKSLNDSVKINIQKELVLPEEDIEKLPKINIESKETPANCGSDKDTAPWIPIKDNLEFE